MKSLHFKENIYNFYELQEADMKDFRKTKCYVVVNLRERRLVLGKADSLKRTTKTYVYCGNAEIYNHSGDDGKEDPPVPIPNTEVKLFYAESTYG